jgi:hypothetical protein
MGYKFEKFEDKQKLLKDLEEASTMSESFLTLLQELNPIAQLWAVHALRMSVEEALLAEGRKHYPK